MDLRTNISKYSTDRLVVVYQPMGLTVFLLEVKNPANEVISKNILSDRYPISYCSV